MAYINTTQGPGQCPTGLVGHVNSAANQRECGRNIDRACSSVTYPTGGHYTTSISPYVCPCGQSDPSDYSNCLYTVLLSAQQPN